MPSKKQRRSISCVYEAEIHSGSGAPTCPPATVVDVVPDDAAQFPIRCAPARITAALAPAKAALLSSVRALQCAVCDGGARRVCSLVAALQGRHEPRFHERILCSCDECACIAETRRRRNQSSTRGGAGLAYRCALEPIGGVLSFAARVGKIRAPDGCENEKENRQNCNQGGRIAKKRRVAKTGMI